MMEKRCKTCRYVIQALRQDGRGWCCRYPPVDTESPDDVGFPNIVGRPRVYMSSCCGEWQPQEEASEEVVEKASTIKLWKCACGRVMWWSMTQCYGCLTKRDELVAYDISQGIVTKYRRDRNAAEC